MEASAGIRQASRDQSSFDAVKARVVTHAFGLRLGAFGLDYTSKKVTVDPDEKAGKKRQNTRGQEFETELERERLRERVFDASFREASSMPETSSSHPDPAWRRGLAAYAKARDLVRASGRVSTKLAVA
ncbi:MAG: hypothetical protein ACOZEN_06460 [Thermodesulfobacteriota bacterium]